MQRFFFDDEIIVDGFFEISGEKYNHLIRVIRLSVGEKVIFCDGNFNDFICQLVFADQKTAKLEIIESFKNQTEPEVKITVFQCVPKGEKMDDLIKRCVQFGAYEIVPVISKRCVSRPDKKSSVKKIERYNKIARSSAMQSMRGYIPKVTDFVDFNKALDMMQDYESKFICYENEKQNMINSASLSTNSIAFIIGPEGGLEQYEVDIAAEKGISVISLGRRILRTEDAATFLIPILLFDTNNL